MTRSSSNGYRTYRQLHSVPQCHPQYARYEQLKQAWIAAHPASTPSQYTAAMQSIAKEFGV